MIHISQIEELVAWAYARCLGKSDYQLPKVAINPRLKTTAGRAFWDSNLLDFNGSMCESLELKDFRETILHEAAHLIAYKHLGAPKNQPHGAVWKRVMARLGIHNAKAKHQLFAAHGIARPGYWKYLCDCGLDHEISTITHNRIQRGERKYYCKTCKSGLIWSGK